MNERSERSESFVIYDLVCRNTSLVDRICPLHLYIFSHRPRLAVPQRSRLYSLMLIMASPVLVPRISITAPVVGSRSFLRAPHMIRRWTNASRSIH